MNIAMKDTIVFSKNYNDLGTLQIRPLDVKNDYKLIHSWVAQPYAKYWGMINYTEDEVKDEYSKLDTLDHHNVFIGMLNQKPVFLMERYDPSKDIISKHYEALPSDVGMHILVAPIEKKIPKFTWYIFTLVMDFLFSDSKVNRIVVEPDSTNEKIHVLNTKAGFKYLKQIQLPHKKADLAVCTRDNYINAIHKINTIKQNS